MLTIVGSSNAVNLTDGLDGLAIGCTLIVSFVFVVLTYLAGNFRAANVSAGPLRAGGWGIDGFLRGDDRRGFGLSMVQLSSGANVYGRYRFAGYRRRAGNYGRADSSATGAGALPAECSWPKRVRSCSKPVGFNITRRRYGTGQRIFLHGALAPSFRKEGMVRVASGDAILHFVHFVRRGGVDHPKNSIKTGATEPFGIMIAD